MSDLNGKKPSFFFNFAKKKNKLGFLALEYSGHGKSSGKFVDGNISKWSNEASVLIKKIVKKNKFLLIGSSMGAWISLNQILKFKKSSYRFCRNRLSTRISRKLDVEKVFKKKEKEIKKKGIINLKHGEYEYPITYQLIRDGKKNRVLNKIFKSKIKVTMIHGQKDKSVPTSYSRKIIQIFKNAKKKLIIIKNGDHSLSKVKWLKKSKKKLSL